MFVQSARYDCKDCLLFLYSYSLCFYWLFAVYIRIICYSVYGCLLGLVGLVIIYVAAT